MRIISGTLKRKKLFSVPSISTRPTSDRIKENIFNILANQIIGKNIIDLFAGTGALGIEALSRGAISAYFIDKDQASINTIKKNIISCSLTDKSTIIKWDIIQNLNCIQSLKAYFNMVFMDPPYNKNLIIHSLLNLHKSRSLANNAALVIEHEYLEPIPNDINNFELTDQRKYGKTLVSFLKYMI